MEDTNSLTSKPLHLIRVKLANLILAQLAIACVAACCGYGDTKNEAPGSTETQPAQDSKKPDAPAGNWQKLVMHAFRDVQGAVVVEMPFPSNWEVMSKHKQGEPTIVGPNGIKVIDFPLKFFIYTSDPRMQQSYRAAGQQLRPMPGVEQII